MQHDPLEDAASLDGSWMPRPDGLAFRDGVSARALMTMTFPPIKFIVPGYIVEGLTIFAGAPKLGKSWACLGFGIAVASGGMAFGSIRCEQGAVLYLALEDNPRRL
ncbi:AAA family ATPase, partial [Sphingomonas sp.]|uniref:AAA family ATPase n=1 Tax=Sphingomonas sp. TaxID=28214 RepID=UPI0035A8DB4C